VTAKKKIGLLFGFRLRDYLEPRESLSQLIDRISAEAKSRGLTREILESILNES